MMMDNMTCGLLNQRENLRSLAIHGDGELGSDVTKPAIFFLLYCHRWKKVACF